MARQKLGRKKLNKLRRETGLDIVGCFVRGNTNHRKDLCMPDGSVYCLFSNGRIERSISRHGVEVYPVESRVLTDSQKNLLKSME